MQILYHLNNNLSYHLFEHTEDISQKELDKIRQSIHNTNGEKSTLTCVVVDNAKVIMTSGKLSAEEKKILNKSYKFKRGMS